MDNLILIGLDMGTQGVRAMAVTQGGEVIASASKRYEVINAAVDPLKEQDANDWRAAAFSVLGEVASTLKGRGSTGRTLLSIDGTSGTILPIDAGGMPLRNAIMYNDSRSTSVVAEVHAVTAAVEERLGYRMSASYALPKICWVRDNQPDIFARTSMFIHQADYLAGCLTGTYGVTDYSNALKTGYDLLDECWPVAALDALGIDSSMLPLVVRPGEPIGTISAAAAEETGLPAGTLVVAGATDGIASCIASGVVRPGQFNSTIGTTLVMKGVTTRFIKDPAGRIYCHKHPEGYWYPGGAGNVGGLCLNTWFGEDRFDELNAMVPTCAPTGNLIYPLTTTGERFPFVRPDAEGFSILVADDEASRYAGTMEGVGYVERLCFDTLESLGCEVGDEVTIAGGAAKAPVWSQVRSNILGKRILEPTIVEAAFGSAVIAGTVALGRTLTESAQDMVKYAREFEPDDRAHETYDELYGRFLAECEKRKYIDEHL